MPAKMAVPIDWRISAPAPEDSISGIAPSKKASEVIRMGRRRVRAAAMAASRASAPAAIAWRANSTIRMAFLAARPISTTMLICVSTLLSRPRHDTPTSVASTQLGTISTTDRGSSQLSNRAASSRYTSSTARPSTMPVLPPACFSCSASSVHS